MILVNTDYISGKTLETLSMVSGSTIQSKHIGSDIISGLKSIVGGEVELYTRLMDEARQIATDRMVAAAETLGAEAIINIRFTTSNLMPGAAEIFVYGTAVKFSK